ncbi:MAG TPA: hypothetical protein VFX77_09595 [Rubrobacter sp.]|nr:hypothetical protein [Rubrobacter sp.]
MLPWTLPEVIGSHVEPGDAKLVSQTLVFLETDSVPAAGQQDRY